MNLEFAAAAANISTEYKGNPRFVTTRRICRGHRVHFTEREIEYELQVSSSF